MVRSGTVRLLWRSPIGVTDVSASMEYTKLKCTERVCEAIESAGDSCDELREWKESEATNCIPFPLLLNVHTAAAKHKRHGEGGGVYLHELLEGSELVLPSPDIQPQRSAELKARLRQAQALAEQKEYNRMVKNIDPTANQMNLYEFGLEVQSVNRQICAILNFLVTVVGAFAFGYFAGHFAGFSVAICAFFGLVLGMLVFMADLYFLVRTPHNAPITTKLRTNKL